MLLVDLLLQVYQLIQFLDLEINTEEHTVKRNGEEISLTPMEFEVFLVLLKNKNIAISREKLLQVVWGTDYFGETRTVDVHIRRLRKNLQDKENTLIRTVRSSGYALNIDKN